MNTPQTPTAEPLRSTDLLGTDLIAAERERQITREGFSTEHDDHHGEDEIACAAESYLLAYLGYEHAPKGQWPWHREDFKPSEDPIRNLVKAGALIAAEIDRLNRARREVPSAELSDSRPL